MHRLLDVLADPLNMLCPIRGVFTTQDCGLEAAVAPLVPMLPDVVNDASYALFCMQNNPRPPMAPASMTFDHMGAVRLYTHGNVSPPPTTTTTTSISTPQTLYEALNIALRSEDRTRIVPFFPYLKLLLTALKVCIRRCCSNGHTGGDGFGGPPLSHTQ